MKKNILQEKSFNFALEIIIVYKELVNDKEFVLSKQLLKSGTSIGANVEEAIGAQSRADFVGKLSIAYKEARETCYWIKLLSASGYLKTQTSNGLLDGALELCRIIGRIQVTMKQNLK